MSKLEEQKNQFAEHYCTCIIYTNLKANPKKHNATCQAFSHAKMVASFTRDGGV